ncbi:universal stress protein [Actinokineospora soli]|uniref:Universal stress protein n=1 Tax=Actinokineospora soli TaxID=1048753 RepID=A0ABW2TRT2_9PSEU
MSRAPVVVGVDGSESSLAAVGWAAREAAARGTGLRVVHAFIWPMLHVPLGPATHADPGGGLRADARASRRRGAPGEGGGRRRRHR